MASANYDIVGQHYSNLRQPDPRIAKLIHAKLRDTASIVNIGAGTGSYEPSDKLVAAVDPSETMIAQRNNNENTTVYRATAENLPFASDSFDAALAILTIHHWDDWRLGLQEALRVAKSKIVLFTWVGMPKEFWLFDYFPEIEYIDKDLFPTLDQLSSVLGNIDVTSVPIPSDCTDGFLCAYWNRPQSYLDARIRSAISTFSRISNVDKGLMKLSQDLESGEWYERYGYIQQLHEFDFGYRLVVSNRST
jgi:SAM-dependent methyltransferase